MKQTLDSFKLYYERLESEVGKTTKAVKSKYTVKSAKPVAKKPSVKKITLKARFDGLVKVARVHFNNIKKRLGFKIKKAQKLTKEELKTARGQKIHGIIGIGLLFVVVSIAYSTYMTVLFVDGITMALALTPQVIFASVILLIAFYKIYK